ncbi:aldehyde dehydrogenase family protein [Pseudorhodoplanes sp.]|uniref:aldehyde dehydrogenase family protein n=1 Tax=Pseudorhodoplanes sp. TaxID=1934341 RepID=UPI003D133EF3
MTKHAVYGLWINNKEIVDPSRQKESVDPSNNQPWMVATQASKGEVDQAVNAARQALKGPWGSMPIADRVGLLHKLASLLREDAERLADIECLDTGKLLGGALIEMKRAADYIDYYAGVARAFEGVHIEISPTRTGTVVPRPRGVVAAITPFNGPVTLTLWKLAPALATGNTIIIKPSPETPATPGELGRLAAKAGFPPGVVNILYGDTEIGEVLVTHPGVDCVAFTGSSEVGRKIAAAAASSLKHVLVEGGGKSAFVVFDDASIDLAIKNAVNGVFGSTGQTCVAGSRMLIHRPIYDQFVDKMVSVAKAFRVGNPRDVQTQMGPLTTRDQIGRIDKLLSTVGADGGKIVAGGHLSNAPDLQAGNYYLPTLITGVSNNAEVSQREFFGPVGVILPFSDEDEAVEIANGTPFGLAVGIWTENIRRANRVSRQMQAGTVWVNCYRAFEHTLPFGGFKQSGLGRENGMAALREYTQLQTIINDFSPK